jgi:hypothetical protein
MKRFFLSAVLLMLCPLALAQYSTATLTHGLTNIAGAITTNLIVSAVIDTTDQPNTALQASFKLHDGVETGDVTFTFRPLVTSTTPTVTLSDLTWVVAATATTTAVATTNWPSLGYGYLKLVSIQNANTAVVTNLVVTYSIKKGAQ